MPKPPQFACNDCGVDVLAIGDWYMARPEVWHKLGLTWSDNLCVACLDRRLGRPARAWQDITPIATGVDGEASLNAIAPKQISATLIERFGFGGPATRKKRKKRSRAARK